MSACATKSASTAKDFLPRTLTGRIAGSDWTYRHAYVDPTIEAPGEDDFVFIFLPYKPAKGCPSEEDGKKDSRSIMVAIPKIAHRQTKLKSGTGRSLMFHYEKGGQQVATAAKSGKVELLQVGDRSIKGRIMGTYNDANFVNGTFTAVVCDRMEMKN